VDILKKNIVVINKEGCKSCSLCIPECSRGIIKISEEINRMGYHPIYIEDMSKCIGCTLCAIICPDSVIEVYREED